MPLTTGTVFANRYRAVQMLGKDEPSAVYRGWDINLQLRCAIKEYTGISDEDTRSFFREAQALTLLSHSNLAKVMDHFIVPNQGQYLVMDYIDGEDLGTLLARGGPIPEETLLPWMAQVMDALHYLHSQNPPVLHREVKPANIRITPQGKAVLVGFGVGSSRAAALQAETPEQDAPAAQADIYALGATMYTLLTGQALPGKSNLANVLSPAAVNPNVSQRTSWVVMKALESEPRKRFQSVLEIKRSLNIASGTEPPGTSALPNNDYAQNSAARPVPTVPRAGSTPTPPVQTLGKVGKSGAARGGTTNTSKTLVIVLIVLLFLCIGLIAAAALLLKPNAGLVDEFRVIGEGIRPIIAAARTVV